MSTLPAETALLALALLTYSDDEGFFNANPRLIQAALFPLRELSRTITVMVQELSSIGYVEVRNLSDGRQIGRVCNFDKHQSVPKAQRSKLKDAFNGVSNDSKNGSEHSSKTTVTLPEDSSKATGGNREQGTGNREQGKEQGIPPTPKGVRRGKGAIVPGEQPEPLRSRLLCLNRIPVPYCRQEKTPWLAREVEVAREAGLLDLAEADFAECVETVRQFYAAKITGEEARRRYWKRTTLPFLLANWPSELDKARAWQREREKENEGRFA